MKIQIRRPSGHGDVLSLTSVIPGLKKKFPGIKIYFMTSLDFDQLILHDPRIERLLSWHEKIPWDSEDPIFMCSHGSIWGAVKSTKPIFMFESQCKLVGVEPHLPQFFLLPEELEAAEGCDVALANRHPPGGARSYRHMSKLSQLLLQKGYHVKQIDNCPQRLGSGVDDKPLTIREAAVEAAKARCVVTIDSVFLHVGVALKKRMVVIFNQERRTNPQTQFVPDCWIANYLWSAKRLVPMVQHLLGDGPAPDEENTFDPAYRRGYE